MKKNNIILIAKPPTKLKNVVHRKINPRHKYKKTVVYIIPFKVNSSMKTYIYVGMTVWKLLVRFKEHMAVIARSKLPQLYSVYKDIDSCILFKEVKIVAYASQYNICVIRESLETWTRNNRTCNNLFSYNMSHIW